MPASSVDPVRAANDQTSFLFESPGGGWYPPASASALTTHALVQVWVSRHAPTAQIEQIASLASAVIGDREQALQWLSEPKVALDNNAPIDLIGEQDGFERVKALLMRIECGVLA